VPDVPWGFFWFKMDLFLFKNFFCVQAKGGGIDKWTSVNTPLLETILWLMTTVLLKVTMCSC